MPKALVRKRTGGAPARSRRGWVGRLLLWAFLGLGLLYGFWTLGLVYLRWLPPLTTSVQIERRVEALWRGRSYRKRYRFVRLGAISRDLQHAVISAEDTRFYQHHGFDWEEMQKAVERGMDRGRLRRGASTITQQLVKNLFLTTRRSIFRKALEFPLVPLAETILSKNRILELYLNVIEWGPGIYGAEAAAQFYYHVPAARVGREQAARMAAVLPAPATRRPARMNEYSAEILARMRAMGW